MICPISRRFSIFFHTRERKDKPTRGERRYVLVIRRKKRLWCKPLKGHLSPGRQIEMGDLQFWKQLAIFQMASAALSFASSTAMIAVIAISTGGCRLLSTSPYRRIIFGLSISDALLSIALLVGPFSAPSSVPQALWGLGNDTTCALDGFVLKLSQPLMYSCLLCFYFLCRLCKTMSDREFNQRIEWKLHIFIILFGLVDAISCLLTGTLNTASSGTVCTTAPFPTGCRQRPEIFGECDPFSLRISSISTTVNSIKSILVVACIVTCMSVISYHVIKVLKVARQHYTYPSSPRFTTIRNSVDAETDTEQTADLQGQYERWSQLMKETVVQILLYTTGFLLTYCPMLIYRHFFRHRGSTPKIVLLIIHALFPLGGFFNILIYTRGAVLSFRREHPDYGWCRAFYEVFKAGGEVPRTESNLSNNDVGLERMRKGVFNRRKISVPFGEPKNDSHVGSSNLQGNAASDSMNVSNVAHRPEEEWFHVPGSTAAGSTIPYDRHRREEIDEPEEDSDVFPISLSVKM